MYDTVKMLIESTALPEVDFVVENTMNFKSIREATETELLAANFSINKIPVSKYDNKYVVEFSSGVERYMKEQNVSLEYTMDEIARVNGILVEECVLIVDVSAINSLDLSDINFQRFDVARR